MLHDDGVERHHDRCRILDDDSRRHVRFLYREVIEVVRPCNPADSHKEEMRYIAYPECKDARRDKEENSKNDKRDGNTRLNDDQRRIMDIKEMFSQS